MNTNTKNNQNCSGCSHEDTCRVMYENLGQAQGPSVLGKVFLAFLTPIFVFIASLAGANTLLQDRLDEKLLTVAGFLLASCVTLTVVLLIRAIRRPRSDKTTEHCKQR